MPDWRRYGGNRAGHHRSPKHENLPIQERLCSFVDTRGRAGSPFREAVIDGPRLLLERKTTTHGRPDTRLTNILP